MKDLARALGVQCYVFNCSDQMDYRAMGQIYKGLAQTGAWGCFDEFNRIPVAVLSVCSTQYKASCRTLPHLLSNNCATCATSGMRAVLETPLADGRNIVLRNATACNTGRGSCGTYRLTLLAALQTVLDALRARKERFTFEDTEMRLRPSVMAFITMNPGYPGRAELPESLKVLSSSYRNDCAQQFSGKRASATSDELF